MERDLLSFVWRNSRRQQLTIVFLTFLSFPFFYVSLEIPKIIINEAINGTQFPRVILGFEFQQVPYLLLLCGTFLFLIVVINALKWQINVGIGTTGEMLLSRMRFTLFEQVMRFPMRRFRTIRPGEVIQSVMGEIEPLGGFVGEVIATPVFQGGLLLVYLIFIFVQDPVLGLAAISLYPVQMLLIPKLQALILRLNRERAASARDIADRVGEGVENISDIRTNDTARWHLARLSARLHHMAGLRRAIYERKFTIKFVNNFTNQLTPFFFYSAGGYMVIKGELDFGSLVAVLAAYKDLSAPWRTLLTYIQRWSEFNNRYRNVVDSFADDDILTPERIYLRDDARLPPGPMTFASVSSGTRGATISIPSLRLSPGETVALVGGSSGAREAALRIVACLDAPSSGRIEIAGQDVAGLPLSRVGASIGYVGQKPGVISGSVRDNLIYGLLRAPAGLAEKPAAEASVLLRDHPREFIPALDAATEGWIDLAAAGVTDTGALDDRLMQLVERFGLSDDLFSAGLNFRLPRGEAARWSDAVLAVRGRLAADAGELRDLVEPWRPDRFNANGSVLANLLYALPMGRTGEDEGEAANSPAVAAIVEEAGAAGLLEEIGWDIASEFAAVVQALDQGSAVLDAFSAYRRVEIVEAAGIVQGAGARGREALPRRQRARLRALAMKFVETRDQLDVLGEARKAAILEARARIKPAIETRAEFAPLDEARYNPAMSVAENILHAQRRFDRKTAWKRLDRIIETVITEEGLRPDLVRLGLGVREGDAGLSGTGRRRLALVRAVVKRPAFLVLDGLADGADEADRQIRAAIRDELPGCCLIFAASSEEAAQDADRVARIDASGSLATV